MKKLKFIGLFIFSLALLACGGESAPTETKSTETQSEETTEDLKGLEMVDLSEYDIEATMHIPDGSKGKQDLNLNDAGSLEINVGKKYAVEIVPFGATIAEKKEELDGDLVYTVEYITEDANHILYKKTIADSDREAEFHFFMNIDLNGDIYEIKNMNIESYSEKIIEKMINSAKTLSAKQPA